MKHLKPFLPIGLLCISLAMGGCSDNVEPGLYADQTDNISIGVTNVLEGTTSTRAEIRTFFISNGHEIQGCGAYVTAEGSESTTVRYEGQIVGSDQFTVLLTDLLPKRTYSVQPYLLYALSNGQKEVKGAMVEVRTIAIPSLGDINPPSINS